MQLYGQQQQATDLVAHVRFLTRSSAATTSVVAVTSVVSIKVGPRRLAVYYSDENFMGLSRDTSSNSTTQDRTYVSHTHTCTPSTTQDRTYVTHTQLYTTLNEHLGFSRAFKKKKNQTRVSRVVVGDTTRHSDLQQEVYSLRLISSCVCVCLA